MVVLAPSNPRAGYVIAHGAGAGMRHPFLEAISRALLGHRIASLRFEFPYMEAGKSRPDSPAVAVARVREAVERAGTEWPGLPLLAGGKSFGGRMSSTAQAQDPLPGVRGLVFLGFPLHPPGRPGTERADHLLGITIPMLFLQGSRDEFAQLPLLTEVCARLGPRAALQVIEGADHSFRVSKKAGPSGPEMPSDLAGRIAAWSEALS